MRRPIRRAALSFLAATSSAICLCAIPQLPADAAQADTWGLDRSFSGDGTVTARFPGGSSEADWVEDIAVQPDGRIVVVGTHTDYSLGEEDGRDVIAARFLPDGTLDPSFADKGLMRLSVVSEATEAMSLQQIGGVTKILIVAELYDEEQTPQHPVLLVRLNPDGSLDTDHDADPAVHLDHDGIATVVFQRQNAGARAIAVDSQSRILIVGRTTGEWDEPTPALVARLQPDGRPDRTFGENGQVVINPSGRAAAYHDIALIPGDDGHERILLCGWARISTGERWLVSRLLDDGSLDPEFGQGDGHTMFPVRGRDEPRPAGSALGIAADQTGRITVVGTHRRFIVGGAIDVPAMVRLEADGDLDQAFSGNGKVQLGTDEVTGRDAVDVTLGADGVAYWVGTRTWPTGGQDEFVLVGGRRPDGSKDHRFGSAGSMGVSVGPAADNGMAITMDSNGRLVLAARSWLAGGGIQKALGVARLALS